MNILFNPLDVSLDVLNGLHAGNLGRPMTFLMLTGLMADIGIGVLVLGPRRPVVLSSRSLFRLFPSGIVGCGFFSIVSLTLLVSLRVTLLIPLLVGIGTAMLLATVSVLIAVLVIGRSALALTLALALTRISGTVLITVSVAARPRTLALPSALGTASALRVIGMIHILLGRPLLILIHTYLRKRKTQGLRPHRFILCDPYYHTSFCPNYEVSI